MSIPNHLMERLLSITGTPEDRNALVAAIAAGGGGGGGTVVAGAVAMINGSDTVNVVFAVSMVNTNYAITYVIQNTTDPDPARQTGLVIAKSTTGFTISLNSATDTSNYFLLYTATKF